jgi:hypothetical protein
MEETDEAGKRINEIRALLLCFMDADEVEDISFVSDESMLADFYNLGEQGESMANILSHFPEGFNINEDKYLWQIVDDIKQQFPNWPQNFAAN